MVCRVSASPTPSPIATGATARERISASPSRATSASAEPVSTKVTVPEHAPRVVDGDPQLGLGVTVRGVAEELEVHARPAG